MAIITKDTGNRVKERILKAAEFLLSILLMPVLLPLLVDAKEAAETEEFHMQLFACLIRAECESGA